MLENQQLTCKRISLLWHPLLTESPAVLGSISCQLNVALEVFTLSRNPLTPFFFSKYSSVSKCYQHRPLRISYPKFAFQTANDIFGFEILTGSQQLCNNRNFFGLRGVSSRQCDVAEILEYERQCQGFGFEEGLLTIFRVLGRG